VTTVYQAIASLKEAIESGIVQHAGKYLVGILRRIFPELFDNGHKHALRQPEQFYDTGFYPKWSEIEPDIAPDWKMNMEQIQLIRAKLAL
jgi:hypothetical protein